MNESATSAGEQDQISSMLWYFLRLEATEPAATLAGAAEWIGDALGAAAEIWLIDEAGGAPRLNGAPGVGGAADPPLDPLLAGVLERGQPWRAAGDEPPAAYAAALPLSVDQQCAGLLALRGPFSASDSLLQAYALGVGGLVRRLRAVARQRAELADQARHRQFDQLAALLGHDVGNLIAPLQGRLELMERRAGREARERDLRDIRLAAEAAQRMQQVLRLLGDSSLVRGRGFAPRLEPLDLAELAAAAVAGADSERGAVVLAEAAPAPLLGDPALLRQALDALLRFAQALAGPEAAAELRVLAPAGGAAVEIRSPGAAVAPDRRAGLFDRFSAQLHGKTGGLGLYVARGIAEAHGGALTVDTAPAGVTLALALPARPAA